MSSDSTQSQPTTANYEPSNFERPSLTVDVVIFSLSLDEMDLRVLLTKRDHAPFADVWALPGVFVGIEESLEDAATRGLTSKTSADSVYLEQLYTFGEPTRDPRTRVITVAYFALIPYSGIDPADSKRQMWASVYDVPALAFDHANIVKYAYERLRYKLEYTTVGFKLLPNEFTLTELQRAYEIILQEKLDKRNFRRKILSAEILEETGRKTREGEGRPAKLYVYRDDAIAEVKTRRLFP